jgi:hypothetical protein
MEIIIEEMQTAWFIIMVDFGLVVGMQEMMVQVQILVQRLHQDILIPQMILLLVLNIQTHHKQQKSFNIPTL